MGFSLPIFNIQTHFSPFPVYVEQNVVPGTPMLKSGKTSLDQQASFSSFPHLESSQHAALA